MPYKLIACDMDETLLNDHHQVCQRNIDAIQRAKHEFGVKFVPATGRGFRNNFVQHTLYEVIRQASCFITPDRLNLDSGFFV